MKLTDKQKEGIAQELRAYVARYASQNKAAESLKGTSSATISAIVNGKWDKISDDMWLTVHAQIARNADWKLCRTAAFDALSTYMEDAKEWSNVVWVTGPAGIGKSTTAAQFERGHRNVFLVTCSEDMHKSDFIHELAQKIGIRVEGLTVRDTLKRIIKEIVTLDRPLLIFDEGDKLTDSVLYYYISLYNALEEKCGMVFLSTNYMCQRVRRGVQMGRKGYDELESRICRKFIPLDEVNREEVIAICEANGLVEPASVRNVLREAEECGNDLRRVKKLVHRELRRLSGVSAQAAV